MGVEGRPFEGGHLVVVGQIPGLVVVGQILGQILGLVLEELQNQHLLHGAEGVGRVLAVEKMGLLVVAAAASWTCQPCLGSTAACHLLAVEGGQNHLQEAVQNHLQEGVVVLEVVVAQILVLVQEEGEQNHHHVEGEEAQILVQEEGGQSLHQVEGEVAQSLVQGAVVGIQPSLSDS